MTFKRGKWQWVWFNDNPVPFPIFVTPQPKRRNIQGVKPIAYGVWTLVPMGTSHATSFDRFCTGKWCAVQMSTRNKWETLAVSPGFSLKRLKAWCDARQLRAIESEAA